MAWTLFGRNWLTGICCVWPFGRATIPNGWQECDGTNGTPDWRGLFVQGAAAGVPPGDTGGNKFHLHDMSFFSGWDYTEHNHNVEGWTGYPDEGEYDYDFTDGSVAEYEFHRHYVDLVSEDAGSYHRHLVAGNTGLADELPPYVRAIWIMKM